MYYHNQVIDPNTIHQFYSNFPKPPYNHLFASVCLKFYKNIIHQCRSLCPHRHIHPAEGTQHRKGPSCCPAITTVIFLLPPPLYPLTLLPSLNPGKHESVLLFYSIAIFKVQWKWKYITYNLLGLTAVH